MSCICPSKKFQTALEYPTSATGKKRTYDEVFNTLKVNVLGLVKPITTSIDALFEPKRRHLSEDTQLESMTTIIQRNVLSDDDSQTSDEFSSSSTNHDTYPKKNKNNYDDDERLILSQIFGDIFAQLENEKHLIRPNSVLEENIDVTSIINSITNVVSPSIIENQNNNDNDNDSDVLMSLNDLISNITERDTIHNENSAENDDIIPFINSTSNIPTPNTSENQHMNDVETSTVSNYPPINRPPCVKISLPGVRFITDRELRFIDEQRVLLKGNLWLPSDTVGNSKPSQTWFTESRATWLRAVYSEKKYGLLCIVCAQEAKCKSRLIKNKGSFVSHPYWKLAHKGLDGMINYCNFY